MKKNSIIRIESLMEKPIWQMTGEEFCALSQYASERVSHDSSKADIVRITGVRALAEYMDCCDSTVFMLRRNGVLDDAIISQVGKKIVFDGNLARKLASKFQDEQRSARRHNG